MTDDFFYTVDPDYPVEAPSGEFDEATVIAACQDYDPRHAEVTCPWSHEIEPFFSIEQTRSAWGDPTFVTAPKHRLRDEVRKRLGYERNIFRALFRRQRFADDETFFAGVRQQSALHILEGRLDYPPTFHLHGLKDTIVPVQHTTRLIAKLEGMGMPLEAILPVDADHCFDCSVTGPSDSGWNEWIMPCMDFVDLHTKPKVRATAKTSGNTLSASTCKAAVGAM